MQLNMPISQSNFSNKPSFPKENFPNPYANLRLVMPKWRLRYVIDGRSGSAGSRRRKADRYWQQNVILLAGEAVKERWGKDKGMMITIKIISQQEEWHPHYCYIELSQ